MSPPPSFCCSHLKNFYRCYAFEKYIFFFYDKNENNNQLVHMSYGKVENLLLFVPHT